METTVINELFLPFGFDGLGLSLYGTLNIILASLCSVGICIGGWRNPGWLVRPAFMVGAIAHLIFQWPLAIFSSIFERSLEAPWFFAISVHVTVTATVLWIMATPWLTDRLIKPEKSFPYYIKNFSTGSQIALLSIFVGLTGMYLFRVGWQCTGLYSMLFNPELALLAREVCGKMVGAGFASYGFGILANVVCPLIVFASLLESNSALKKQRYGKAFTWTVIGISALLVVLLPGAKGGLIPTIIVVCVGMVATRRAWLSRIVVIACVFGGGFFLLSAVDTLRERRVLAGGCYKFGECVSRLKSCWEAKDLLDSLRSRDMSLGLSHALIRDLELELDYACFSAQGKFTEPPRCLRETKIKDKDDRIKRIKVVRTDAIQRIWQYARAIAYRAAVVPVQVAGWHYQFVADYGSPGLQALPLARIFFGKRVVMPIRVHEAYYHIYSGGDRTSTGTSPTSFLLAYPAYLGFVGIALSLAALLTFDLVASTIIGRLHSSLWLAGVGLIAVGSLNFIASDFGTTLLSHGTAAALLILFALSFITKD